MFLIIMYHLSDVEKRVCALYTRTYIHTRSCIYPQIFGVGSGKHQTSGRLRELPPKAAKVSLVPRPNSAKRQRLVSFPDTIPLYTLHWCSGIGSGNETRQRWSVAHPGKRRLLSNNSALRGQVEGDICHLKMGPGQQPVTRV